MQVIVDNILTSYKKYGSGNKVILYLHGWGDSMKSFDSLSQLPPKKYTTILLDLPGFGGSAQPPLSWGLPEYGKFIGEFLKKVDLIPYGIVGHSNGGAVAIYAAGSGVVEPKKLVLIASSGIRSASSVKKTVHMLLAKIAKLLIVILPKKMQRKIKRRLYTRIGSDYMVVEELQEVFKRIVSYDISSDAKKIKMPALLIYGSNDLITPLSQAEKIKSAIPESRLEVIDGAEHFLHKEQPEEVKKLIEDFLK